MEGALCAQPTAHSAARSPNSKVVVEWTERRDTQTTQTKAARCELQQVAGAAVRGPRRRARTRKNTTQVPIGGLRAAVAEINGLNVVLLLRSTRAIP